MKVCAIPVGQAVTPTRNFVAVGVGAGGAASSEGISARAVSITARVFRMASLTGTAVIGLPAKRAMSTWTSEATITTSAAATSAGDSGLFTPSAPCVSTRISWPIRAAVFFSASAAM